MDKVVDNIMGIFLGEEPIHYPCRGCSGKGYNQLKSGAKVECVVCRGTGEVPREYLTAGK